MMVTEASFDAAFSAGFHHDAGLSRVFDVWETRADGERFITEKLRASHRGTARRCG